MTPLDDFSLKLIAFMTLNLLFSRCVNVFSYRALFDLSRVNYSQKRQVPYFIVKLKSFGLV